MAIKTAVYAADLTGNRGKQIRTAVVEGVTWVLNGIHTADISIHPLAPDGPLMVLDEAEAAIIFNRDFSKPFAGVFKTKKASDFDKVTFTIESPITYMQDAFIIDTDKVYTGVEQMNIATGLVTYGQAATYQDRNILIGTYSGSGVFRDITYLAEEYKNIYSALTDFPGLDQGFDWDVIIASDGTRRFTPFYPRKGSQKNTYRIWKNRGGASKYFKGLSDYTGDGNNQYTDQIVTGPVDPTTGLKLRGRWQAGSPEMTRFGRKMNVTAAQGTVDQAWVDGQATGLGLFQVEPSILPDIIVSDELFGLIEVGDSIPVDLDYGLIQVQGDYRIAQLNLPMDGTMKLTLQEV